jgi:hypothetical protein
MLRAAHIVHAHRAKAQGVVPQLLAAIRIAWLDCGE